MKIPSRRHFIDYVCRFWDDEESLEIVYDLEENEDYVEFLDLWARDTKQDEDNLKWYDDNFGTKLASLLRGRDHV